MLLSHEQIEHFYAHINGWHFRIEFLYSLQVGEHWSERSTPLRTPGGWWGAVTDALIIGLGENALSCDFFCTNAIR